MRPGHADHVRLAFADGMTRSGNIGHARPHETPADPPPRGLRPPRSDPAPRASPSAPPSRQGQGHHRAPLPARSGSLQHRWRQSSALPQYSLPRSSPPSVSSSPVTRMPRIRSGPTASRTASKTCSVSRSRLSVRSAVIVLARNSPRATGTAPADANATGSRCRQTHPPGSVQQRRRNP